MNAPADHLRTRDRKANRPRILPCGERAVLAELETQAQVHAYTRALNVAKPAGVREVIPAARTVLVTVTEARQLDHVAAQLKQLRYQENTSEAEQPPVTIPVTYDGADLAEVCALSSLTVDEVIDRHTATTYTADFLGFAPGFAYLSGLDPALYVPRRSTPRTHVPAGAVAIAGEYSAVYPRSSPGGWQLIGHTDQTMFDPAMTPPALLQAGVQVRFEAVDR